ncbi:hypothetical protein PMAYCL1PPCAC_04232, partial [Pristionchus mayeri]
YHRLGGAGGGALMSLVWACFSRAISRCSLPIRWTSATRRAEEVTTRLWQSSSFRTTSSTSQGASVGMEVSRVETSSIRAPNAVWLCLVSSTCLSRALIAGPSTAMMESANSAPPPTTSSPDI